ncbi:glycosyltransferase family 4 protein [Bacillus sp. USDA818B3_A]|uniref:glycosyltransferase family 4 protein n=1 Tax=Bacillus sp. USDA818B3_A TaxID=2698834 RepID=UPI00137192AE|nr:glycosyltransferase family 4 protein [Bacillus sp. USDA818B3_A]
MKLLWITNQAIPIIAEDIGINIGRGGGWLVELSRQLSAISNIELCIAFPIPNNKESLYGTLNDIQYYAVPFEKNTTKFNLREVEKFESIIREFKPDLVHIWGTEYIHSYCAMMACKNLNLLDNTVISIQGLVSIYAKHFDGYIEEKYINKCTIRELIKRDSIVHQKRDFVKRGKYEIEALKIAKHVIGRTDWDSACSSQINPNVQYHFCNETLRNQFYNKAWDINQCERHSIFVSQSQYPIKGLHILLEALPTILKKYPNTIIYTTGRNRLDRGLKAILKEKTYDKYLIKLIKKYSLENHVVFLGGLNENEMSDRFCKSHVFVSASSIENSPNSVGEAMLLGVPVVTSDVGGVKNMIVHEEEGYVYQADAPYMLAHYICNIFHNDEIALKFSQNGRRHAQITHNREVNLEKLLKIYRELEKQSD